MTDLAPTATDGAATATPWHLRAATTDDIGYISRRWHGYFGVDRSALVDDLSWMVDHDASAVLVAEANDELVGCGVGGVRDGEDTADWICPDRTLIDTGGRAGYLAFGCVAPGFRGRGIHTALVGTRVRDLLNAGADRIYTLSWVREDHHDSVGQFSGTWDVVDYFVDGYGSGGPFERDYCPDCGETCSCDAILWRIDAADAEVAYAR